MTSSPVSLEARFERAVRALGGTVGAADFAALAARYRAPHRHYHDLSHVEACLHWLDRVEPEAEAPAELALAIFFHDAIYERAHDDEAKSALLAETTLTSLGVAAEAARRVRELVLATMSHEAEHGDAALLVDIDLSILGAPPDAYARYVAGVRSEHAALDEETFRAGRSAFVRGMLARVALYVTPAFRALEPLARENLIAELRGLDSATPSR